MARPKSEDKRKAILAAATRIFAERGVDATPTSAISKLAGVAEGTLFTYFRTKDELINELYREIKLDLAPAMLDGFPREADVRERLRHVWLAHLRWGMAHPDARKVLAQLSVSAKLTTETRQAGQAPFGEVQCIAEDAVSQQLLADLPMEFVAAIFEALSGVTIALIEAHPEEAERYAERGFEVLWKGLTAKPQ